MNRPESIRVRMTPPPVRAPLLDARSDQLRYWAAAARYPPLRGTNMRLGRGAQLLISDDATVDVQPGFRARRDFTLVARGVIRIGREMFCNRGVVIAGAAEITIGDQVRVGERTSIIDHDHVLEPLNDLHARFRDYDAAAVSIGHRVLISANCVILPGAVIGDDAVVAAGAVVRGTIPPRSIAAGAPAEVVRVLA